MHYDLVQAEAYHRAQKNAKKMIPVFGLLTFVSGYNISRFGVLSQTGRLGATFGLLFGSYMTYSTITA